jgi:hypothetical protein
MRRLIFLYLSLFSYHSIFSQQTVEIVEVVNGHIGNSLFLCDSKSCEGYQIERFPNGIIRIEGKFSKGKAIGNIKSYFQNGNIFENRQFGHGRLSKVETFDSTGKLINLINWKKKKSITYEYSSKDLVGKTKFVWKRGGWQNGLTTYYKWENNKWIKK